MSRHILGDKIVVDETRRRWSDDERRETVNKTLTAPVSPVARKRGIAKSLLFRWRKEAGLSGKRRNARNAASAFVPVELPTSPLLAATSELPVQDHGAIEIELSSGHKLLVSGRAVHLTLTFQYLTKSALTAQSRIPNFVT